MILDIAHGWSELTQNQNLAYIPSNLNLKEEHEDYTSSISDCKDEVECNLFKEEPTVIQNNMVLGVELGSALQVDQGERRTRFGEKAHLTKDEVAKSPTTKPNMKLYSCKLCHVTFHTKQGLYNHNYKTHLRNPNSSTLSNRRTGDQSKTHNIPLKDKEKLFTSHQKLSEHEPSHHIGHGITCPVCQKGFARKRNLALHIKSRHPEAEKFLCKTCRWAFFFKEDCTVHEELHEPNSYVCFLRDCYHNRFKGQRKETWMTYSYM